MLARRRPSRRARLRGSPVRRSPLRSRSTTDRVAVIDAAAFDRLEARGAVAQALQRLVDRFVVDAPTGARSEIVE